MDTNHPAGSPREGYPIEIQALWHAALEFLSQIDSGNDRWRKLAEQMQSALIRLFMRPETPWLIDCLHATPGTSALAAEPDDALRPNQLFAITLGFVSDSKIRRQVLSATTELLVPGGMRSLADRPVTRPIEILHRGNRLGDHYRPYRGVYTGDEDTSRKPAYHNGTAWTWLLPVFCEAWADTYGEAGKPAALAWLSSLIPLLESGCTGHLPETLDGDRPHRQRGCEAQAWSVSEALRVHRKLFGPA
jgi:predicted glycogen debranching enzyme